MRNQAIKSTIIAGCTLALVAGSVVPAAAKPKPLSDKSVRVLMNYAWSLVPGKFTAPTGKVIITDKTKPKLAQVPMQVAREVIRVGRLSAFAQNCDLLEEQIANYRTLMRLERDKKTWSDQQMLFINQLHLLTVMWLTGQAQVVAGGTDKAPKVKSSGKAKKISCDAAHKEDVRAAIFKYVKANPPPKRKASSLKPKIQPAATKSASSAPKKQ